MAGQHFSNNLIKFSGIFNGALFNFLVWKFKIENSEPKMINVKMLEKCKYYSI